MRRILLHVIAIALSAAGFVMRVFPVKRRVVFMSRQSDVLSLDYRLLAKWIREEKPGISIEECLSRPETRGLLPFAFNTLQQLKLAQTSTVVVVDGYVPAVSVPKKRDGVMVIQLWHAMGAIKKFGYQCLDTPDGRSSDSARILSMHKNYDYAIAGGSWAVGHLAAAFDMPSEKVLPLGLPRGEFLVSDRYEPDREVIKKSIYDAHSQLSNGNRNVLYAPTFRRTDMAFGAKLFRDACECFSGEAVNLIYSGHPLGEEEIDAASVPENVILGQGFATIDWLLAVDILVTDYSAVAYEAAVLGVPVLFYVPDIDEYRASPGLNVDPLKDYPSCSSTNFKELAQLVMHCDIDKSAFTKEVMRYETKRSKDLVRNLCESA